MTDINKWLAQPPGPDLERKVFVEAFKQTLMDDNARANALCEWFSTQHITEGEGVCAMMTLCARIISQTYTDKGFPRGVEMTKHVFNLLNHCIEAELRQRKGK